MSNDPDLTDAYALKTADDAKRLYADWAKTYDTEFGDAQGYQIPREVVRAFSAHGGAGPVLDVGAGTGLVGEGLAGIGAGPVDALDLSPQMLDVARQKGIYRDLIAADVTLALPVSGYSGVVSAGTFTLGHVGPEGLPPLLDAARLGCLFVLSVNLEHFKSADFEAAFASMAGRITAPVFEDIRIYSDKADLSHRYDRARLVIFRTI
ncbi:class I SAM-dependent DNA methyltransferase [Pseudooctadecabacter sp.]|uniref:class I SAM-dependent DNA methyltransferase n=1 Tax=Pseudooctadecabacter sp. TaxID=1966338 RepID=UPI0035C7CBC6